MRGLFHLRCISGTSHKHELTGCTYKSIIIIWSPSALHGNSSVLIYTTEWREALWEWPCRDFNPDCLILWWWLPLAPFIKVIIIIIQLYITLLINFVTITALTKILSSRYNFLKTCFGMTYAIISLMCCSILHCFIYVYSLSTLTIWNLKYSNSYNSVCASARVSIT